MSSPLAPPQNAPVKVVNPYGEPETIDPSEVQKALSIGYRMPTSQEISDFQDAQTYGGTENALKAGVAGAARGASFGLSDQLLTRSGLAAPETLSGLEKFHPVASGAGQIAGIGGALLLPGLGEAGAAAEAGGSALGAADLINPVQAVAKVGSRVTEAATPLAEKAAGLIANPETSPIAHRILSGAAATGMGSAVEGAAYGLGQSVSEQALGDPDLNAEKVMSNVGFNALLAGGIGAFLGGASKGAFGGKAPTAEPAIPPEQALKEAGLSPPEAPATDLEHTSRYGTPGTLPEQPTLRESTGYDGLDSESKQGILQGLKQTKENSGEIIAAAQALNAPLPEGLISDSPHIQRIENMLVTSPTPTGIARSQLYEKGYKIASDATARAVGEGTDLSQAELGNVLKQRFTDAFEAKAGPVKELYNQVGEYADRIPISDRSTGALSRTIRKIIDDEGLVKGTPEYSLVDSFADGIDQVDTLQRLQKYRSALARASSPESRFVSGLIKDKLDSLEQRSIRSFADTMKTPEAKEKILNLLDQMDQAKSGYRALREDMGRLGKNVLGRSKIYGPQDFLDAIEAQTPEKFAKRLFAKDNSEFLGWVNKNFPDEMKLISQYQRAEIREAAMKSGEFRPTEIFKQVEKLSPEVQGLLFTPAELKQMEMAKTYLQAFPKDWNPSHTSSMDAYRLYFSHPVAALGATAKDYAALRVVKGTVGQSSVMIQALSKIERAAQKTTTAIQTGAKAIFSAGSRSAVPVSVGMAGAMNLKGGKTKHEETAKQLNELSNQPETLIEKIHEMTQDLWGYAPNTTGSLQATAARATSFLSSKLPQMPDRGPLSPKLEPSRAEISRFYRYYDTVENPVQVLQHVRSGTLVSEQIETLATIYPKLYGEMRSAVMNELTNFAAKGGASLPYPKKMALSLFLNEDLDSSLTQPAIAANQMAIAQGSQQPNGSGVPQGVRPSQKGLSSLSGSNRLLTSMQDTAQRERG